MTAVCAGDVVGAADEQRHREAAALHLAGDVAHLFERGRDETGQADHVRAYLLGRLEDLVAGHHDAEIDDREVVALEHDADDVLADVVHVALDRGEHHRAVGLLHAVGQRLDERDQMRHGLFHDARGLDHLRQEHLARAEQVADHVHAVHERAFDDVQRMLGGEARFFRVFDDVLIVARHQRMAQALAHRQLPPGEVFLALTRAAVLVVHGDLEQALRGIRPAIEDHVLDALAQVFRNVVVNGELAGVHDAEVHARLDRVVQEHRVHGLAHGLVAAERERHVADAAGDVRVRAALADLARGFDELHAVVVVLFDAGGDREDVRIEDDVFGREADLLHEQLVAALADLDLALERIRLALSRRRP